MTASDDYPLYGGPAPLEAQIHAMWAEIDMLRGFPRVTEISVRIGTQQQDGFKPVSVGPVPTRITIDMPDGTTVTYRGTMSSTRDAI